MSKCVISYGLLLQTMYEAATVEDIYHLYNCFKFDDNSIFTCIGISGEWETVRRSRLRV